MKCTARTLKASPTDDVFKQKFKSFLFNRTLIVNMYCIRPMHVYLFA